MSNNTLIEIFDKTTNHIECLHSPSLNVFITKTFLDEFIKIDKNFNINGFLEKSKNDIIVEYTDGSKYGCGLIIKTNYNCKFKINEIVYFLKEKIVKKISNTNPISSHDYVSVNGEHCYSRLEELDKAREEVFFEKAQDATSEIKAQITEELETTPVEIDKDEDDLSSVIKTVLDLYKLNKNMLKARLRSAVIDIKVMEKIRSESKSNEEFEALKSCLKFFLELGTKKTPYDKCIEISSTHYKVSPSSLKSIIGVRNNAIKTAKKIQ